MAGVTLMRLGLDLTFLAWNDRRRAGCSAERYAVYQLRYSEHSISAIASMSRHNWIAFGFRYHYRYATSLHNRREPSVQHQSKTRSSLRHSLCAGNNVVSTRKERGLAKVPCFRPLGHLPPSYPSLHEW